MSGSGIGGLIIAPITQKLLDTVGFAWTMRITALYSLIIISSVAPLLKNRLPLSKHSSIDWAILKNIKFDLLLLMGVFATLGYLIPFFYIPTFAIRRVGISSIFAASLLSIFNGCSAVGRIAFGVLSDYLGHINTFILCMLVNTISMCLWSLAVSEVSLIIFVLVNGMCAGGFISLLPVSAASLFGVTRMPSLIGMLFSVHAIGNGIGPVVGGLLLEKFGFTAMILHAGAETFLSTMCLVIIKFIQSRRFFAKV